MPVLNREWDRFFSEYTGFTDGNWIFAVNPCVHGIDESKEQDDVICFRMLAKLIEIVESRVKEELFVSPEYQFLHLALMVTDKYLVT